MNSHFHTDLTCRLDQVRTPAAATAVVSSNPAVGGYFLRFRSLFNEGRGYAFPCDAAGHVDLDALGDKARNRYYYARSVVGRDFSMPTVQLDPLH